MHEGLGDAVAAVAEPIKELYMNRRLLTAIAEGAIYALVSYLFSPAFKAKEIPAEPEPAGDTP
jgi:hypothetical protein